jgi:hypothetical protein
MKAEHLRAFLWLRWRIRLNQLKKGGFANVIALAIIAPFVLLLSLGLCAGAFVIGLLVMPRAEPVVFLYVFAGIVLLFLFVWAITLLTELQRSDVFTLDKFLHLPVSLKGVFLINYLSSLASVNLVLFVPAMMGLAVGAALGKSAWLWILVPLIAALVFMVTSVTYQFQGWLASLMVNPRRRKTVIVLVTMAFVLVCQLPQLINVIRPWDYHRAEAEARNRETAKLQKELADGRISKEDYALRNLALHNETKRKANDDESAEEAATIVWWMSLALPPGWLALGAMAAAQGNPLPGLGAMLGLGLIGTASLWRSYRTTLRLYTGQFTSGKRKARPAAEVATTASTSVGLVERELPWFKEQVSAIALAGFRALVRAPEAKMLFLTPLILAVVFGSMLYVNARDMPEPFRPLVAFGGLSMTLLGMIQVLGNQFGFDRNGFRVFVLCAVHRRDILLGKNLALAPIAVLLGLVILVGVEIVVPMRWDHLLAALPQMVSMYLLFCIVANLMSILAPTAIAANSLKPANPKLAVVLLQMCILSLMPLLLLPLLVPLGLETVLEQLHVVEGVPIYLPLSLLLAAGVVVLYRAALNWEGNLLQYREKKILEVVTTKVE